MKYQTSPPPKRLPWWRFGIMLLFAVLVGLGTLLPVRGALPPKDATPAPTPTGGRLATDTPFSTTHTENGAFESAISVIAPDVDKPRALEIFAGGVNDDLWALGDQLWISPVFVPRINDAIKIGLTVNRRGGRAPLQNVTVRFYEGDPQSPDAVLIGDGNIPLLSPRVEPNERINGFSTSGVGWVPTQGAGEYTLYGVIDPNDQVPEEIESNNVVSRTVQVLAASPEEDEVAPRVDLFEINDSATVLHDRTLSLHVEASDFAQQGGDPSGVTRMQVVEYLFNDNLSRWDPIQATGWLTYTQDSSWELSPSAGTHYLQAWTADAHGNISRFANQKSVNYAPSCTPVVGDAPHFYRQYVKAGDLLQVDVTPCQGDADVYIWPANWQEGQSPSVSNQAGDTTERLAIVAEVSGEYQIEVYGYTSAQYNLAIAVQPGGEPPVLPDPSGKPIPTEPVVPPNSRPDPSIMRVAPPPVSTSTRIYLPLTLMEPSRLANSELETQAASQEALDSINHGNKISSCTPLTDGGAQLYRQQLQAGETLHVEVVPCQGDPDLYIWAPDLADGSPAWVSNQAGDASERLSIVAEVSGEYEIEVYGYTSAEFTSTIQVAPGATSAALLNEVPTGLSRLLVDQVAPRVDQFRINEGSPTTVTDTAVSLYVASSDFTQEEASPSGVSQMQVVEYLFDESASVWMPVQASGWLTYSQELTWELYPMGGLRFLQVWTSDAAGNVSRYAYQQSVNYAPPCIPLARNDTKLYRRQLEAGEILQVEVTPCSGDPDLYIWPPNSQDGQVPWVSNRVGKATEFFSIMAPLSGEYEIEVYGFTAAEYNIAITVPSITDGEEAQRRGFTYLMPAHSPTNNGPPTSRKPKLEP